MKYQILLLILLIIAICFIGFYKNSMYTKNTITNVEKITPAFLQYLDKFYIKNRLFTILCTIFYIIGNISIVFFLRFFYKSNKITDVNLIFIIKDETIYINFSNIFHLFISLLLFFILLIFYKLLLTKLFFDDVLKLHIYLHSNKFYEIIQDICKMVYITNFFGKFYLFFHNINKLRIITSKKLEDTEDIDIYDHIYNNDKILKMSRICVIWAENYKMVFWFFIGIKKIFRWLYIHVCFPDGLIRLIPYFLFFVISFYDFIHFKIYYSYYCFIPIYLLNLFFQLSKFVSTKNLILDKLLYNYFYKNTMNYTEQRHFLKDDTSIFFKNFDQSKQNLSLLNYNQIKYVLNDFEEIEDNLEINQQTKRMNAMYKRWMLNFIYLIIISNLAFRLKNYFIQLSFFNVNMSLNFILFSSLFLILYGSRNIYKYKKPDTAEFDYSSTYYVYNKNYLILYWILILSQFCVSFILLFLTNLNIENEILFEKFEIKLLRYFTIEEKIMLFNKYFMLLFKRMEENKIYEQIIKDLKIFKEELNISDLITETTTINDIRLFIKDILQNYLNIRQKIMDEEKLKFDNIFTN